MKKTILLAALVISASIGSQVASAATATGKVGVLTFALTDTYQHYVTLGGTQDQVTACALKDCNQTVKYTTGTDKIDNKRIITAIGKALGVSFTSKAQLVVVQYDNDLPDPAYPPYLACENDDIAANTFNAPVDYINGGWTNAYYDLSFGAWPNEQQIDWVDYSTTDPNWAASVATYLWPKATVRISDPSNSSANGIYKCVDVSSFFSFEEASCYFCWDTVDRVTSGIAQTKTVGGSTGRPSDICIANGTNGTPSTCGLKGSGTTRWYFTIKFNNVGNENQFLGLQYNNNDNNVVEVNTVDELTFAVSGVVSYPWKYNTVNGFGSVWGVMTMSQANGYGREPYCGVFAGSVKITETDNTKVPLPCVF
jgi:hypothetical protein